MKSADPPEREVRTILDAASRAHSSVEATLALADSSLLGALKSAFGEADMQDGRDERRLTLSYL